MSDDTKTPNFTRLNDENYSLWVVRMEADLISRGLWNQVVCEAVTKEMKLEEVMATEDEWKRKRKKTAEARAAIIQRVEDSQLTHMRASRIGFGATVTVTAVVINGLNMCTCCQLVYTLHP
jgi:hypothetical protein